jgi:hypothetical protein
MSEEVQVRMFRPENKLSMVLQNGGMLASEALSNGNKVMKELRKPALKSIDRLIEVMGKQYGAQSRHGDEDFQGLYDLSARIIDICGPVADLQIHRAAFSLCELVDRCAGQAAWDWPSVDVHMNSLQLLSQAGAGLQPAQRKVILEGLDRLTGRLPPAPMPEEEAEAASEPPQA